MDILRHIKEYMSVSFVMECFVAERLPETLKVGHTSLRPNERGRCLRPSCGCAERG